MIVLQRRRFFITAMASLYALSRGAVAQEFPSKPIHLVVPYGTGGPTDTVARLLAERMGTLLRQPVIVENKGGAGGNIGAAHVAQSLADGYTLLMGTNNQLAANLSLFNKLPFDPLKDFTPIGMIFYSPSMVAVNPSVPATTVAELIRLLKQRPNYYSFGSGGIGASSHFAGELMNKMAGVRMTHVPYKSDGQSVTDAIGGHLPIVFCNISSGMKFHRTGELRALGVTSAMRAPAFPDIPTIAEGGLPGFDISAWFSMMAPAGTPPSVVRMLNDALRRALQDPKIHDRISLMGGIPAPTTPEEVTALIQAEIPKWGRLAKEANIRLD